jgi:4,5-DOPA dioxygenase extradiol
MKLHKLTGTFVCSEKIPVFFVEHGSPMNSIGENQYVKGFRDIATD